jgi:hypothetical protein
MPQGVQHGRRLGQQAGVGCGVVVAVANHSAKEGQGDAAQLVHDNVSLHLVNRPDIIENVVGRRHIDDLESGVGHFCVFFLSYLRKEIAKIYSYVREKNTQLFPIVFDLWSINFGI